MNRSLIVVVLSAGTVLLSQAPLAARLDRPRHRSSRRAADRRCGRIDAVLSRQRLFAGGRQVDVQHAGGHRGRGRREDRHAGPSRRSSTGARGGYFARRTREIYYAAAAGGAVTRAQRRHEATRTCPTPAASSTRTRHCRSSRTPRPSIPRQIPAPAGAAIVPQLQRMFPGKRMEDLTPDQQYSVKKEDGLAPRALNPGLQSFVFTNLKTGECARPDSSTAI